MSEDDEGADGWDPRLGPQRLTIWTYDPERMLTIGAIVWDQISPRRLGLTTGIDGWDR